MPDRSTLASNVRIRRLGPADAALYRDIRLEALRRNPEGFGSTFAAERERPFSTFAERLADSHVVGAFHQVDLVGMAGFRVQTGMKNAHKGSLWGVYVRADARGIGIGKRLVEAILEVARHHVELVQLSVVSDSASARRLYSGLGFVEYGLEKRGLKDDGRYYDQILMAKDLGPLE